jgi:hypothetical protein
MTNVLVAALFLAACGGSSAPGDGGTVADDLAMAQDDAATTQGGDLSVTTPPTDSGVQSGPDLSSPPPPPNGAPGMPGNFEMTHQGASDAVLVWTAAAQGDNPVDHYQVYRNGKALATTKELTYTDSAATNITTPGPGPYPYQPATVYSYSVSAVDTKSVEGAQQKNLVAWVYHNGTDYWTTATNNANYNTTSTNNGTNGITVTVQQDAHQWQPRSGNPFLHNMSPTEDAMELGAFSYMTLDFKAKTDGEQLTVDVVTRETTGDNFNSASVTLGGSDAKFGPASKAGQFVTYKIPFVTAGAKDGDALMIGVGTFTASISGTTMTVTKLLSGINVQGSSYLSGTNVNLGDSSHTHTYVGGTVGTTGQAGTYTIAPSQTVASTTITAQRTNVYKFGIDLTNGKAGDTFTVNNIGFSAQ